MTCKKIRLPNLQMKKEKGTFEFDSSSEMEKTFLDIAWASFESLASGSFVLSSPTREPGDVF